MDKPADTQYPIHDLLRHRWSPRAFDERPVEREKLCSLCEAARWAPSSSNEQPWRLLVATKEALVEYDRLLACLLEGNRKWAYRAPVLILSIARLNWEEAARPNRHASHDVGLATQNLLLQATSLGLVAHPMAGFDIEKARAACQIPEGYEPMVLIAVGYPGDSALLSEHVRAREAQPRVRKPLTEWVYSATWGHSSPLVQ